MKKLFLFATIAAAGLFASCSSTDDAIGDAANSGIEGAENAPQAIKIGIGSIAQMDTRGTGTVGGVKGFGTEELGKITNKWAGQSINVFMFTKDATTKATTLNLTDVSTDDPTDQTNYTPVYLYNNTEMITPGSAENLIPQVITNPDNYGEAMIKDGTIQYYPLAGNFDFFGYHLDDALNFTGTVPSPVTPDYYIDKTDADKWTVPFQIDGSQDLMSTKAALATTATAPATSQADIMSGLAGVGHDKDYYSAYAARKGIQPILSFNHLLSRFAFFVKAGNKDAAGYTAGGTYTQDEADTYNANPTNVPGALPIDGTALTADQADAYNATLTAAGALPIDGTTTLSAAQATAYNNTLSGLKSAGETIDAGEAKAWNAAHVTGALGNDGSYVLQAGEADLVNSAINPAPAYSDGQTLSVADADAYNATLTAAGALPIDGTTTLSAAQATAYNATKGAKAEGQTIDAATAKAWNAVAANVAGAVARDGNGTLDATLAKAWNAVVANVAGAVARDGSGSLAPALAKAYNATLLGHVSAGDPNPATPGTTDPDKAVKVARVMVKSKVKGNMAVAWTGDLADNAKIVWDNQTIGSLTLQDRPYAKKSSATALAYTDFTEYNTLVAAVPGDNTDPGYAAAVAAVSAKETELDQLFATNLTLISETLYNRLTAGATDLYTVLSPDEALNEKLIALTPTAAEWDGTTNKSKLIPVGEALIVGPTDRADNSYYLEVDITQNLPTNWNPGSETKPKMTPSKLLVKAPAEGWKPNYSYNIILTVYGLERIEVMTVVTPWDEYVDDLTVGADD